MIQAGSFEDNKFLIKATIRTVVLLLVVICLGNIRDEFRVSTWIRRCY
jgi:hypothetical protein